MVVKYWACRETLRVAANGVGEGWAGRELWLLSLDRSVVIHTLPLAFATMTIDWHQEDGSSQAGAITPWATIESS